MKRIIAGLLIPVLIAATPGLAQSSAQEAAMDLFRAGLKNAASASWDAAARYFEAAHAMQSLDRNILYNAGLARARAGNDPAAMLWWRAALEAPAASASKDIEAGIRSLETRAQEITEKLVRAAEQAAQALPEVYTGHKRQVTVQTVFLRAALGNMEEAQRLAETNRLSGLTEDFRLRLYGAELASAGNFEAAHQVLGQIKSQTEKDRLLRMWIETEGRRGNLDFVLPAIREISDPGMQRELYLNFAGLFARSLRVRQIEPYYQKMETPEEKRRFLALLVLGYLKIDRPDKAREWAGIMAQTGGGSALSDAVLGQAGEAFKRIRRAEADAKSKTYSLYLTGLAFAWLGDLEAAGEACFQALQQSDSETGYGASACAAVAFEKEDTEGFFSHLNALPDSLRAGVVVSFFWRAVQKKKWALAEQTASSFPSLTLKAWLLVNLTKIRGAEDGAEAAAQLIRESLQTALAAGSLRALALLEKTAREQNWPDTTAGLEHALRLTAWTSLIPATASEEMHDLDGYLERVNQFRIQERPMRILQAAWAWGRFQLWIREREKLIEQKGWEKWSEAVF